MKYPSHTTLLTVYIVVVFCSELTLSVSLRLSGTITDEPQGKNTGQNILSTDSTNTSSVSAKINRCHVQIPVPSTDVTKGQFRKRACNGFPCMYSHLGTKAAQASLYNTLAGFIDDCFADPNCDPGRKKRDNTNRIRTLINTPLSKLHLFGAKTSKQIS